MINVIRATAALSVLLLAGAAHAAGDAVRGEARFQAVTGGAIPEFRLAAGGVAVRTS